MAHTVLVTTGDGIDSPGLWALAHHFIGVTPLRPNLADLRRSGLRGTHPNEAFRT